MLQRRGVSVAEWAWLRQREGRQAVGALSSQTERPSTGSQHRELGTAVQDHGDQLTHGVDQVLAVVDDEQVRPAVEDRGTGRPHVAVYLSHPERGGQRVRDGRGIGDRCQQHDRRDLGLVRELACDASLADAAWSDDRDKPLGVEQSP